MGPSATYLSQHVTTIEFDSIQLNNPMGRSCEPILNAVETYICCYCNMMDGHDIVSASRDSVVI